jgi:hypothetical protein
VTKEDAIDRVNPFRDRNVSDQLGAWAVAVELAVATLNQTLAEFKEFQEKGDPDVGDAGPAADTGGSPAGGLDR